MIYSSFEGGNKYMDIVNFVQVLADTTSGCTLAGVEISSKLTSLIANIITAIKVVIPILLIVWGMLDLGKAVIAQKEDEIKKGQQTFMKRAIAAVIVFFIPTIVGIILGVVDGQDACVELFTKL